MAVTLSITTGDGYSNPYVAMSIVLPDSLANLSVAGNFKGATGGAGNRATSLQAFSGSVTPITPNGSSQQTLLIQYNPTTNTVSEKTGTSSVPTPDAGNVALAQQIVPASVAANTVPSLQGGWTLINQW